MGICNKEFKICITPVIESDSSESEVDTSPKEAYNQKDSTRCEEFRESIDWLRFSGDPDADFDYAVVDQAITDLSKGQLSSDDDSYLESVYCFTLIPFAFGLLLLLILTCSCCIHFCLMATGKKSKWEETCCCYDPDQKFHKGQVIVPFVLIMAYSLLILFFCANAVVQNGEISDNLVEAGGVLSLINETMTIASDYLDNAVTPTGEILEDIEQVFDDAQQLVDDTDGAQVLIDDASAASTNLADTWTSRTLRITVSGRDFSMWYNM
eukprot:UN06569